VKKAINLKGTKEMTGRVFWSEMKFSELRIFKESLFYSELWR
jgi:hypothetical protein